MADRFDPSQRAFTAGPADGTAPQLLTDTHDTPTQAAPDGAYASPADLEGWDGPDPDAHAVPDLMHTRPGRFYAQGPRPTRIVGHYRPISPFGGVIAPGHGLIAGFNLHETTGTVGAFVKIHDGADSNAPTMLYISLGPGESTRDWYFPGGLKYKQALYVEVVTGAIEGVLYSMETEDVQ